jgi:hypothetical protein
LPFQRAADHASDRHEPTHGICFDSGFASLLSVFGCGGFWLHRERVLAAISKLVGFIVDLPEQLAPLYDPEADLLGNEKAIPGHDQFVGDQLGQGCLDAASTLTSHPIQQNQIAP